MQATNPSPARAAAGTEKRDFQAGVTALLNRSKNLLLVQAWLNKPDGVAFAKGAINAYQSMLGNAGQFLARRDAESPGGYLPFADFQAAWASLPNNTEHLTMAQVQDFLHANGVELATDTVTNGHISGVVKLKDDVVTTIDQHDKHDAAPAAVGDGAGCHEGSFVMGVDIQRDGIVTKVYAL